MGVSGQKVRGGERERGQWTRKGRKNTYVSDKYSPEVA